LSISTTSGPAGSGVKVGASVRITVGTSVGPVSGIDSVGSSVAGPAGTVEPPQAVRKRPVQVSTMIICLNLPFIFLLLFFSLHTIYYDFLEKNGLN
jgi:hypothetical protein